MIVELALSASLILGPPIVSGPAEGPAMSSEREGEGKLLGDEVTDDELAGLVAAAGLAAQDRAVLERKGTEVPEFVRQLDALARVEARLDTCGKVIQAELRMDLALAYLRASGACDEDEPSPDASTLEYPRECALAEGPEGCAALLLERAVEFGDSGPGGAEDPLAQAVGCPHAAEPMTVEQMFGSCVAQEYDAAVERWRASRSLDDGPKRRELRVPRWASIIGVGLGVGAIAAGATLVAIDGACRGGHPTELDGCPHTYDTEVGGAVLVSVGALAVLGMGTILAITEVQRSKGKGRAKLAVRRRRMQRVAAITGWQTPRLLLRGPRRPRSARW